LVERLLGEQEVDGSSPFTLTGVLINMSLKRGTLIGDTLARMPAPVVRHLTILQCGKVALSNAIFKNSGDDAWCGASDSAMGILGLIVDNPVELKGCGRMEGIFLKRALFKPQKASLTPWEFTVYQAALNTAEIQMRRLHDSEETS
jgi:hypothetical protein